MSRITAIPRFLNRPMRAILAKYAKRLPESAKFRGFSRITRLFLGRENSAGCCIQPRALRLSPASSQAVRTQPHARFVTNSCDLHSRRIRSNPIRELLATRMRQGRFRTVSGIQCYGRCFQSPRPCWNGCACSSRRCPCLHRSGYGPAGSWSPFGASSP